jgi:hypothetical protein
VARRLKETVGKHLCNFPGEIHSTLSEVASVAGYGYRVTLEVLLRFFVRQQVDQFVARAAQSDGTAFDTITRQIFCVLPVLMPRVRHEMMCGALTHLTVAYFTRWHHLHLTVCGSLAAVVCSETL